MKKILTKMGYMAFGSLLTLIGYYFGNIDNNSANAQESREGGYATIIRPENKTFDEVHCRRLVIYGNDHTPRVTLATDRSDSGSIEIYSENGARRIFLGLDNVIDAGTLEVSAKGAGSVSGVLGVDHNGGFLALYNKLIDYPVFYAVITNKGDGLAQTRDRDNHRTNSIGPQGVSEFQGKKRTD